MSKSYLNKYENGKSQTHHARDRANGVTHQSRVREYLDDAGDASDSSPVVITVHRDTTPSKKTMAQMMLFDQPVMVKLAEPATQDERLIPHAAPATLRPARQSMALSVSPKPRSGNEFTLRGLLKGCGLGLATAAAILLAYAVVF